MKAKHTEHRAIDKCPRRDQPALADYVRHVYDCKDMLSQYWIDGYLHTSDMDNLILAGSNLPDWKITELSDRYKAHES